MIHRLRNILLLFGGHTVSQLGTVIFNTSLAWYIAAQTGSSASLGTLLSIGLLPSVVLNLLGGVVVDRANKKYILSLVDFTSGIGCLILGVYTQHAYNFVVLLLINMLINVGFSFFSPAARSIVPELVDGELIQKSNSVFSTALEITKILGPALAGVLIPLIGAPGAFFFNGASFLVSALCTLCIRYKRPPRKQNNGVNILGDLMSTLRYTRQHAWLARTLLIVTAFNFFSAGFSLSLPFYIQKVLHGESNMFGTITSIQAVGAILSSLWLAKSNKQSPTFGNLYRNLIGCGVALVLNVYPNLYLLGASVFLYGFFLTRFNVNFFTYIQQNVDGVVMGKVFSFIFTIAILFMPIGNIVFGFLGDLVLNQVFLVVGIGMILVISLIGKGSKSHAKPYESIS